MKSLSLCVVVFLLSLTAATAQFRSNVNERPRPQQQQDSKFDWGKIYFGGGGSFGFGTGYSYYSLFPIAGYRITEDFSAGTGITYQHYSFTQPSFTYTQYGVTPFLRYNINPVFLQTELDFINSPVYASLGGTSDIKRETFTRFLVGIGYMSQIGSGRSAFNVLLMYDLLYKTPSVFQSPVVVRVFLTF